MRINNQVKSCQDKPRIVVMGGGTGPFTVLSGLRDYSDLFITAIITASDSGGSSGALRDQHGIVPPGDLGQALAALSDQEGVLRKLLSHRFSSGDLKGHSFSNILLLAAMQQYDDINEAMRQVGQALKVHGRVIPVSADSIHLCAETVEGAVIRREANIEGHLWSERAHIRRFWLEPSTNRINPLASKAIEEADLIVMGPGSLFTSIIPILLVGGMTDALQSTQAKLAYVANLMTEKGQAGHYSVQDFADEIMGYTNGRPIDYVFYNTRKPRSQTLELYRQEMERTPVEYDRRRPDNLYKAIGMDLLQRHQTAHREAGDALSNTRALIRHDSEKLARILYQLCQLIHIERQPNYQFFR